MRIIRNHENSLWTKCKVFHIQECGSPSNQHIQRDDVSNPVSPRLRINMLQNCTLFLYYLHYVLVPLQSCTQTCEELGYRSPYRHWATGSTTDEMRLHSRRGQEIYCLSETSTTAAFARDVSYRAAILPPIFFCDMHVYQAGRAYFESKLGLFWKNGEFSSRSYSSNHIHLCLCNSLNK